MTTQTLERPKERKAGPPKELFRGEIEISRIRVVSNLRKHFDPKRLQELAGNIKKVGVLDPVILRYGKGGQNGYLLVAGERRLRACQINKMPTIPGRVLDINEDEAREIQAFENLHREDLGPIEEAQAFKEILRLGKYTVEDLAQRIDKSPAYVYRSIRLTDLPQSIQELIGSGQITAAHGQQLLRLPEGERAKFSKSGLIGSTAKAVRKDIDDRIGRNLNQALFPKDKLYLSDMPICAECRYNSGNQGMLFDGAMKGRCTNVVCYDAKQSQAVKEKAERGHPSYPKAKRLGVHESYSAGLRSHTRLYDYDLKEAKVKKVLKENPEGIGVALLKGYSGRYEWGIYVIDKGLLQEMGRGTSGSSSTSGVAAAKRAREEGRIESRAQTLFFEEAFKKVDPAKHRKAILVTIVDNLDKSYAPRGIWEALGIRKPGQSSIDRKNLEALDERKLLLTGIFLALGNPANRWNGREEPGYTKVLGLKAGPLYKRCKEQAKKELKAKKTKKTASK